MAKGMPAKDKLLILIFFVAVVASVLLLVPRLLERMQVANCGPGGCPDPGVKQTKIPKYAEMTSYSTGAGGYECSKPIKMVSFSIKNGDYVNYQPVDPEEARVFCHMTYAIEYEGKLTVLRKPEVREMISKYEYKDVTIKALEFEYIEDKEFIKRLLPMYADEDIGCIIIVETPEEKKVYLEDEQLETFEEIDYKVFDLQLSKVSEADRNLFLENLQ